MYKLKRSIVRIVVSFSLIIPVLPQNISYANNSNEAVESENKEVEELDSVEKSIESAENEESDEEEKPSQSIENKDENDLANEADEDSLNQEESPEEESQVQKKEQEVKILSTPKYSNGDSGKHVVELKKKLTQLAFGNFPKEPSDKYGKVTESVVKEFQAHYKLPKTGIADKTTLDKVEEILKPPYKNGHRGLHIVDMKEKLTSLGFGTFPKNPSVTYGKVTSRVVKDFQETFGLAATGDADQKTLDKINEILSSDYRIGKNGSHVRELKKQLTQLGFGSFPEKPSTAYGSVTARVVEEFQAHYKLPMTGIADQVTRNKIKEILNPPYKSGDQGLHIVELKEKLTSLGFGTFPENPSIRYGKVTSQVVKDFQKSFGLSATGDADKKTLDKINEILTSDYRIGKKGSHVRELKKQLTQLGFGSFPNNPSTSYGTVTAGVVKEFQAHYKLPETGIADKVTRDKIKNVLEPPYRNGDRGLAIVQLKKDLTQLGFGNFPKNPSLSYGKVTANVVKEFQKAHNLTQDGIAGNDTLGKIKTELEKLNDSPTIKTTYTDYGITLSQALDIQLQPDRLQQTDKYRNEPAYVSGQYLEFIGTGIITGSSVNVRTKPNTTSSIAYTVTNGDKVKLVETVNGTSVTGSTVWYKIENNKKYYYVHSSLLTGTRAKVTSSGTLNVRAGTNTAAHVYGTLSPNSTVTIKNPVGSWYSIAYNTWRNPTRSDIQEYLDPNNNDKFQHLRLDSSVGLPASELNKVLKSKGTLEGQGQAFINGAKKYGVNEAYLISHAFLETGNGTSTLAKGVKYNGKTVYNMFGIGAVDSNPVNGGAKTAYENGWFTPAKAIEGGAQWIGKGYIDNQHGQNTLYKMRWNPNMGTGYAYKQYATDIAWATKQVNSIKKIYNQIDNADMHYDIPKYN